MSSCNYYFPQQQYCCPPIDNSVRQPGPSSLATINATQTVTIPPLLLGCTATLPITFLDLMNINNPYVTVSGTNITLAAQAAAGSYVIQGTIQFATPATLNVASTSPKKTVTKTQATDQLNEALSNHLKFLSGYLPLNGDTLTPDRQKKIFFDVVNLAITGKKDDKFDKSIPKELEDAASAYHKMVEGELLTGKSKAKMFHDLSDKLADYADPYSTIGKISTSDIKHAQRHFRLT